MKPSIQMQKEIVNADLESMVQRDAQLPNGTTMDLYKLRRDVVLYGISIEGDSYIKGPYFLNAADAVLHALNPRFIPDTIGFATKESPANSTSSQRHVFNSMLRLIEYSIDSDLIYYLSKGKLRPDCQDVGAGNFKVEFELILPNGNDADVVGYQVQGKPVDDILANIVSDKTSYSAVEIGAFVLCTPGKNLRVEKSFRLDMAILWTFYAAGLSKSYKPLKLRNDIMYGPNGLKVVYSVIGDKQIPSSIGDLPESIIKSIKSGKKLDDLLKECSITPLGQKVCLSGNFFKSLYARDVVSIMKYYKKTTFAADDKSYLFPYGREVQPTTPYISNWLYSEDYMPEMGRDDIAYSWNYNRYLDVNTVVYWAITRLQIFMKLVDTKTYSVNKHKSLIDHRFKDSEIEKFQKMIIYDVVGDNKIEILMDNKSMVIHVKLTSSRDRSKIIRTRILEFIDNMMLTRSVGDKFQTSKGFDVGTRIISFLPQTRLMGDIPINWLLLQLISTFLRHLVTTQEFSFFSYV